MRDPDFVKQAGYVDGSAIVRGIQTLFLVAVD